MTPLSRGFAWMALLVLIISVCFWPGLTVLAERPSVGLLQAMATIGATLLVAYAVEFAALARLAVAHTESSEAWLGRLLGAGASGLLGIVLALSLAERATVGHWTAVDGFVFALAASSLLFLALIVVAFPYYSQGSRRLVHHNSPEED